MTAREFILKRFAMKGAQRRGGVSSAAIFGVKGTRLFTIDQLERALKELRDDGTLAYTAGLWWRRSS